MIRKSFFLAMVCLLASACALPQTSAESLASGVWNAVLAPTMDPAKFAHTENVEIIRDRIHITLIDGTIQFTQSVNGVVFGAVFRGSGRLQVDPPNPLEAQQLRLFTKRDKLDMAFNDATFSFTDALLDEISKQVKWQTASSGDDLYVKRQKEREDLGESAIPRLFQAILSADHSKTAFFLADCKTKEKGWVEIQDDALQPEDISIGRWTEVVGGRRVHDPWMSFPAGSASSADAWKDPYAKDDFSIRSYNINVGVSSGAELQATAQLDIEPRLPGQNVLLFDLDANLRVASVKDAQGNSLPFFQSRETKDRIQSYGDYIAVVLASPLKLGAPQVLNFRYAGKRAIRKAGNGNYFCESSGWYPAHPNSFAARTNFDLTFHSPKNSLLVATGEKTSDTLDGNIRTTNWKSEIPLAVAGFAFGEYKVYNEKAGQVNVDVYANREPDDVMQSIQRYFESGRALAAVGVLTPAAMAKTMAIEMSNTIRIFQNYYGPYPYKHLSVTSLPISYSYGQGWPGLIYLWSGSFLDATQRHAIGIRDEIQISDFFRAHEASHQWWGHRVGWKSYHDQWLSEGFAEFSGNLYVQYRQNMKEYLARWRSEKELLKAKDIKGHTIESLGPIWMGQRIASSETDRSAYQDLIYSKGGYVLHMLREQLSDSRSPDSDHRFKEMMWDYCKTFNNKPASTEDFKSIVEKHMTPYMDLDGNHKTDWFFSQYVYGTGIPHYYFQVTTEATPDGKTHLKGQLTRSGVPENWKDVVAIYAHEGDKTIRLGILSVTHSTEQIDAIVPGKATRVSINDNEDLLAEVRQ